MFVTRPRVSQEQWHSTRIRSRDNRVEEEKEIESWTSGTVAKMGTLIFPSSTPRSP